MCRGLPKLENDARGNNNGQKRPRNLDNIYERQVMRTMRRIVGSGKSISMSLCVRVRSRASFLSRHSLDGIVVPPILSDPASPCPLSSICSSTGVTRGGGGVRAGVGALGGKGYKCVAARSNSHPLLRCPHIHLRRRQLYRTGWGLIVPQKPWSGPEGARGVQTCCHLAVTP